MLAGLASIAAVLLAVVFAFAAFAKLRDPAGTRAGLAELGLPATGVLLGLLVATELSLTLSLLLAPGTAAIGAVAVLVVFSLVLAELRSRGNRAPCRCFGEIAPTTAGRPEQVRNGLLVGLGLLATQVDRLVWPGALAVIVAVVGLGAAAVWWRRSGVGNVDGTGQTLR